MNTVHTILNDTLARHKLPMLHIVSTGCEDVCNIALWVKDHDNATFETADLNGALQESYHKELEEFDAAQYCTFRTQDHKKFLTGLSWIDVAFLNADGLQEGLQEFQLAVSAGARVVVMKNFQTNAAIAVRQAQRYGWAVKSYQDYTILLRQSEILKEVL